MTKINQFKKKQKNKKKPKKKKIIIFIYMDKIRQTNNKGSVLVLVMLIYRYLN